MEVGDYQQTEINRLPAGTDGGILAADGGRRLPADGDQQVTIRDGRDQRMGARRRSEIRPAGQTGRKWVLLQTGQWSLRTGGSALTPAGRRHNIDPGDSRQLAKAITPVDR